MTDNFIIYFLVFAVSLIPAVLIMSGAFWVYDKLTDGIKYGTPDYQRAHKIGTRASIYILTAGGGVLIIFFIWASTLSVNSQIVYRVNNQMKLEKHTAVDNCLSKKFGIRHFLFTSYYNEKTGEVGTISKETYDTCKGAF